jgi:hypothetical protein
LEVGSGSVIVGEDDADVDIGVEAVAGPAVAVAADHISSSPSSDVRQLVSDADHGWSVWERWSFSGPVAGSVLGSSAWTKRGLDSTAGFSSRNRRQSHRGLGRRRP